MKFFEFETQKQKAQEESKLRENKDQDKSTPSFLLCVNGVFSLEKNQTEEESSSLD
jgi:phage/plasmid-associated DNA primase